MDPQLPPLLAHLRLEFLDAGAQLLVLRRVQPDELGI